MAALARANAADNGLVERARIVLVDVTAKGAARRAAGLAENSFDSVIANPPFFAEGTLAADAGRAGARHMDDGQIDLWIKAAAGAAAAGGEIIVIYPASGLQPLLAGFSRRFGAITILPLAPRPQMPASRILIRAIKGSRAPLTLLASRALHGEEGRAFRPEFEAIFRGAARLDW
jgi:tRNA1(Val) A37 N6-methylase TrmN6